VIISPLPESGNGRTVSPRRHGFADAIGWLAPSLSGHDHWHVTFTVASRDDSATTAEKLGAELISSQDTEWTKTAWIRDPQGAELTLSQFTPRRLSSPHE
jgi:uncharacterized protein